MKFCITTTIVTIAASSFYPMLMLLCAPLIIVYFILSVSAFFKNEIGKGFFMISLCLVLPLLSFVGMALVQPMIHP